MVWPTLGLRKAKEQNRTEHDHIYIAFRNFKHNPCVHRKQIFNVFYFKNRTENKKKRSKT